jgi:hypothetical protein
MKKKLTAIAAAATMLFFIPLPANAALTHVCTKYNSVIRTTNFGYALQLVNSGWRCSNITIWG